MRTFICVTLLTLGFGIQHVTGYDPIVKELVIPAAVGFVVSMIQDVKEVLRK